MSAPDLISVIIPVYNVEQYLLKCVDSAIDQTYKNLEIILVDDGSTDSSGEMCDQIKSKDARIKVIHKENGGLSSARNAGIESASGEYIAFLDSDDWLEPQAYETLYSACVNNNCLISCAGRYEVYENSSSKKAGLCPPANEVVSSDEMVKRMFLSHGCDCAAWDKLFHRSCFEELRFPEGLYYEDLAIMYKVMGTAERIAFCNCRIYNYLRRKGSITSSAFSPKQLDRLTIANQIETLFENEVPHLLPYAKAVKVSALIHVISLIDKNSFSKKENKELYSRCVNDLKSYKSIWQNKNYFGTLMQIRCISIFLRLHPLLLKIHNFINNV